MYVCLIYTCTHIYDMCLKSNGTGVTHVCMCVCVCIHVDVCTCVCERVYVYIYIYKASTK